LPILNLAGAGPVELIDFPAQATQSVLNACHHFSALKIFEDKGIRLTVCIFASDERAALASGAQIVSTLGGGADYLVIANPARFPSHVFFASKLAERLQDSPQIQIPRITGGTMEALDRASKQKRKSLTFREAEPLLEIGSRYELEHWRNRLFGQFEDSAAALLPDPALVKNRVTRADEAPSQVINPFDL
jgi:hypothetical protein